MNKITLNFLQSWINWIDSGAIEGEPYSRSDALCIATFTYCRKVNGGSIWTGEAKYDVIYNDLKIAFIADGLNERHPFYDDVSETGSSGSYRREEAEAIMHLNERRLAWVRSKVNV
jgi:hypothetical protein